MTDATGVRKNGGRPPSKHAAMQGIPRIRVSIGTNDIPRWNQLLIKSGKKDNRELLMWMIELAEEKLNLTPEESKRIWHEDLEEKTKSVFDEDWNHEEHKEQQHSQQLALHNHSSKLKERHKQSTQLEKLPIVLEDLHNRPQQQLFENSQVDDNNIEAVAEVLSTMVNCNVRLSTKGQQKFYENNTDCLKSVESNKHNIVTVSDLFDDTELTVEKQNSNAPIRKRFRLRSLPVKKTESKEEITEIKETFRKPLKVRRKLEDKEEEEELSLSVEGGGRNLRSKDKVLPKDKDAPKDKPCKNLIKEKISLKGNVLNKEKVTKGRNIVKDKNLIKIINTRTNKETVEDDVDPKASAKKSILERERRITGGLRQWKKKAGKEFNLSRTEEEKAHSGKDKRRSKRSKGRKAVKEKLTCAVCPRVFYSKVSLTKHEACHKARNFPCRDCEKEFHSVGALWHHRKMVHEEKRFKCSFCGELFGIQHVKIAHERKHTGEKPYECKICKAAFSIASTLRNHEKTHSKEKPFLCDTCGLSFRRKDNLNTHISRKHKEAKVLECDQCGKKFLHLYTLRNHLMHHKNEADGKKPFECTECEKTFTTPKALQAHVNRHRPSNDHVCEVCGKEFKLRYYLTKHQATHLKVKPFLCKVCNRGFAQKSNLDIHMRTHTGLKPYTCTICNKGFAHKVSLKSHVKVTHDSNSGQVPPKKVPVKPFPCSQCNKTFSHKVSLKQHVRCAHGAKAKPNTAEAVGFLCDVCNLSFTDQMSLSEHRLLHQHLHDHGRQDILIISESHLNDTNHKEKGDLSQLVDENNTIGNMNSLHPLDPTSALGTGEYQQNNGYLEQQSDSVPMSNPPQDVQTSQEVHVDIGHAQSYQIPVYKSVPKDGSGQHFQNQYVALESASGLYEQIHPRHHHMVSIPQESSDQVPGSFRHSGAGPMHGNIAAQVHLQAHTAQQVVDAINNTPQDSPVVLLSTESLGSEVGNFTSQEQMASVRHTGNDPHTIHPPIARESGRSPMEMNSNRCHEALNPSTPASSICEPGSVQSFRHTSFDAEAYRLMQASLSHTSIPHVNHSSGVIHVQTQPHHVLLRGDGTPVVQQLGHAENVAEMMPVHVSHQNQHMHAQGINFIQTFPPQHVTMGMNNHSGMRMIENEQRKDMPQELHINYSDVAVNHGIQISRAQQESLPRAPSIGMPSTPAESSPDVPVDIPVRYEQYPLSQTPSSLPPTPQPTQLRPDSLQSSNSLFITQNANMTANRVTPNVQLSFSSIGPSSNLEPCRTTLTYTNAPVQRSPVFASATISNQEASRMVANSPVAVSPNLPPTTAYKLPDGKWLGNPNPQNVVSMVPAINMTAFPSGLVNIPQMHRQLMEYTRMSLPAVHAMPTSQPGWNPQSN